MNLGEKINYYRKQKGLMQSELGAQLFVTRQTVSLWEKGQTLPSLDNIVRLAEIFGITIDELLLGELPCEEQMKNSEAVKSNNEEKEMPGPLPSEDAINPQSNVPDEEAKAKEKNKFLKLITGKYAVALAFIIVIALAVGAVLLSNREEYKPITDEKIEEVIGTKLPDYESRTVISKVKETEAVRIYAVTEILFSESVFSKLSSTMKSELPKGVESLMDSAFLYKGCELYAVYDIMRETRASDIGNRGAYVFASYDEETRILRITEFEYK